MSDAAPLRVAIVGCGPKGLYALERLVSLAREHDGAPRIHADIYEPHPVPGAGPVYDPAQPAYLRMNFAADMVNMWPAEAGLGTSFSEWRRQRADLGSDAYPPRADVGRYLAEGFRTVLAGASDRMAIHVRAEAASAIQGAGGAWRVEASKRREYDEVLLATGHAKSWDGALERTHRTGTRLVPAVFPVDTYLSESQVPSGSAVAIRGFALTMIDASLALTEGRGGTFLEGRHPHLLRYEESDGDVGTIFPYSRCGRPMLAKPDPSKGFSSDRLDEIGARGRRAVRSLPAGEPLATIAAILADVASESLSSVDGTDAEIAEITGRIDAAIAGLEVPEADPSAEIERSIAVGVGEGEPGADWAIGHAWRVLYPALVERLGGDGLDPAQWPAFRLLARGMERISFGPPPVNAAKLLALIECGKVDLSSAASGPAPQADIIIDAVIPPPGIQEIDDVLVQALVRDGHLKSASGRRGVQLTADVECVGTDGKASRGLGAIGRPTEDWVIGNDTLNRDLHAEPERWARRVVARAAA